MKSVIVMATGLMVLLCAASAGFTQGRGDAGDRSQRGDSEEFRDTIRQERLKKPTYQWSQPAPVSNTDNKTDRSKKKK